MATTLTPPATAPKQQSGEIRFVAIRAHLLPDEIVSARQVEVVRKQVLVGLAVVVVLLIGWYGLSKWQTISANGDLDSAKSHGISLQNQQNQFGQLVDAQNETAAVQSQLQMLMVGDLSWKSMLVTLASKAPGGVTINSLDGTVTAGAAASSTGAAVTGNALLNQTGKATVGSLTLTGTAPDKRTVATYADNLATVKGLTAPLISDVQAQESGVTFTISAVITSDALGGRYAQATTGLTGGN